MKTKLFIFTILFITFCKTTAQKTYKTNDGHIQMMTLVDGKPIEAESYKLNLFLDYESKIINGVLDLKTLTTDAPEINAILQKREDPLILRFTGSVPSVDFMARRHAPINFNWQVAITYQGKSYKSQFKATITHIEHGVGMSCLISATGQVLVSETGLDSVIPGLDKAIEVQFAQLVLKLE